ncbi:MAG TPA: hypothetical protein VM370_07970 [Candidatus Thermoplasmatota archaeon]|nr:hypothetical protein [Candidatus Thermoplasmatota archaeon]
MWGWLALLIGIAYGFLTPGSQDKMALLKKGLIIGIVIAVVLAILGILFHVNLLGFGSSLVWSILSAIVIVLLFVGGVWLGDLLEGAMKKNKRSV